MFGWLVPGGGYWLLGERVRAVIVGVSVVAVFAMGMLIGGVRVVDAPTVLGIGPLLEKPWFMGQVLIGPIGVAAAIAAEHVDGPDADYRTEHVATSRSWEIGTLYTAVAGMLNLLVIIDAAHRTGPTDEPPADQGQKAQA
jgi:hypothetical protein